MTTLLYLLFGLLLGALLAFLFLKSKVGVLEQKLESASKNAERLSATCDTLEQQVDKLQEEKELLAQQRHDALTYYEVEVQKVKNLEESHQHLMEAQEERHQEAMKRLRESFEQTISDLKTDMKAATEDMLKSRQTEFGDFSQKSMKDIVSPLNDTIARMKEAMEAHTKEQSEFSGSLNAHLHTIIQQTEATRQSAMELTTALKHDSKVQGDYGEVILDELLQSQGFTQGIHYDLQYVMKDEDGKALKDDEGQGLRPDVVFHIDTVRDVIIDSKINLTDFINFANAQTSEEREMHLDRHVKSIERQVGLLSKKDYAKYHKKTYGRMDYVIMFIPISSAWWEALRRKPNLWREAMDSNVYIADEQTLFAALRIIKLTWTQIEQVKNQKVIFELADQMIDRVGQFMKQYRAIGAALDSAQEAYGKAEGKLTPGGQSILTTAQNLLKKGARDSKTNPVSKFLDVDEVEQLPEPDPTML